MSLLRANPKAEVRGAHQLAGRINYLVGSDPKRWRTGISTWSVVVAKNVWPGIDTVYRAERGALECDFVLSPKADPTQIKLKISGADVVREIQPTSLSIVAGRGRLNFALPHVYEQDGARRVEIPARFVISHSRTEKETEVSFELGVYHHDRTVVIDPTLVYSTFLGGDGEPNAASQQFGSGDQVSAIAVDASGNEYLTGVTTSPDFPTQEALQDACETNVGCSTAFVSKIDGRTGALDYSTFLGGAGDGNLGQGDWGKAIAVDANGNAFVAGLTYSTNFPTTQGAYQTSCPTLNNDSPGRCLPAAFVAKLNPTGSALIYSTLISGGFNGGANATNGVVIDSSGDAFVTGEAGSGFPTTSNGQFGAYGGSFATELNPSGSALLYSAVLPYSTANSIALSVDGKIFIGGQASDPSFPTTANAFQPTCRDCSSTNAGMVAILDPSASTPTQSLVYSSFLSGSDSTIGDSVSGIGVDLNDRLWAVGVTTATKFPVTRSALRKSKKCAKGQNFCSAGFLTILDPSAKIRDELIYSTLLDGNGHDQANALVLDPSGTAYVAGQTNSTNFPITHNALQKKFVTCKKCSSYRAAGFITVLHPIVPQRLIYSSYLGGATTLPQASPTGQTPIEYDSANALALDSSGHVHVVGTTWSTTFPISTGALQTKCLACSTGGADGFVTRINPTAGQGSLSLLYSSFIGGNGPRFFGDSASAVALDQSGNLFVTGITTSMDFPSTPGSLQPSCGGCTATDSFGYYYVDSNAFVAELNPAAAPENQLVYATFLGGSGKDLANAIAVDASGDAYVGGQATSTNFPITTNAFQVSNPQNPYGFLAELDATGSHLIYSTALDGASGNSSISGIALGSGGKVFVTGQTNATDFPVSSNAFQKTCPACGATVYQNPDSFVSEIDPSQSGARSLLFSTFLGGSGGIGDGRGDYANAIALTPTGNVVVAGSTYSLDFPLTPNSFQSACPTAPSPRFPYCSSSFVSEINLNGAASAQLVYSTYLGGSGQVGDHADAVAVGPNGEIYVGGSTNSSNFPTTQNSFAPTCSHCSSGFVAALDPSQVPDAQLVYGTYLEGTNAYDGADNVSGIAIGPSGRIYSVGSTYSNDFPVTSDAAQSTCPACLRSEGTIGTDAFISVLDPSRTGSNELTYSTFLGGSNSDQATGIALNPAGAVVVVGSATSSDYPVTANAFQTRCLGCSNLAGDPGDPAIGDSFIAQFLFSNP